MARSQESFNKKEVKNKKDKKRKEKEKKMLERKEGGKAPEDRDQAFQREFFEIVERGAFGDEEPLRRDDGPGVHPFGHLVDRDAVVPRLLIEGEDGGKRPGRSGGPGWKL